MSETNFVFAGVDLVATLPGALVWPEMATLVVADLHLEKGSSGGRRGTLLPPYDSRATLAQIAAMVERWRPRRVIALGDSFHDPGAGGRLAMADRGRLVELTAGREWIWIAGNHDPVPPATVGGESATVFRLGPLVFRHEARPGAAAGEVSGHLHPKAMIKTAGRRIRARCFVTDGRRLILPAFGAYTGGLDIGDPAIAGLFTPPCTTYVLGHTRIHTLAWRPSPASGAAPPGGIEAGHDG